MTVPQDLSHKDRKYFIDHTTYNCPFCRRRNVSYALIVSGDYYDASYNKKVFYYIMECQENECEKRSLHLSNYNLRATRYNDYGHARFIFPLVREDNKKAIEDPNDLDKAFFYHCPTSFFAIDDRVPKSIRKFISEAEGCLSSDFLTGSSACLRKAIYKLLQHEKISEKEGSKLLYLNDRIDLLEKKYPYVDHGLFENFKKINALASKELHENDWCDFNSHQLRFLIETTMDLLYEIYVVPDEKSKRNQILSDLAQKAEI